MNSVHHLTQSMASRGAAGPLEEESFVAHSPTAGGYMESQKLCAYNQTRECFLGLDVTAADLSYASLKELVATLALKSGEGLWLNPFKGIPEAGIRMPLDLVYLDENCRVIDAVESFPTFRVSPSRPPAVSVLVLPTHSVYSSQTQPGDLMVLCMAEEIGHRLEKDYTPGNVAATVQSAVLLREKPLWSGGPGVVRLTDRSEEERPAVEPAHEMDLVEPGKKEARPPRTWLNRWWSPDPRRAPRVQGPGLAAYYWSGGPPQRHAVRDISTTGLYLVTEERWYPGTLILMTLQSQEGGEQNSEQAIAVHSRAVRWGEDGVGLQFVLDDEQAQNRGKGPLVKGVDRKEMERFLQQFKKGKS